MNAMVMDVEGTDGRERGEDQVRNNKCFCMQSLTLHISVGFRTQICSFLSCLFRGPHRQHVGASSRPLPGSKHESFEDRV